QGRRPWRAIILAPHGPPARHHPPALPARLPFLAAVGQGAPGRRSRATRAPGCHLVVPAAAALAARGDGADPAGDGGLAARAHGGGGLVAGRLLRALVRAADRLPLGAAEPGALPRARPGGAHRRAEHLAEPRGALLLRAGLREG